MTEQFKRARDLIDLSNKILLTMHERMDGDDGGSLLALGSHLEKMGKNVSYAIKKGVPPSLIFLPGSEKIRDDIDTLDFNLLITFGCSAIDRCGNEKIINLKIKTLNIDHHPDLGIKLIRTLAGRLIATNNLLQATRTQMTDAPKGDSPAS